MVIKALVAVIKLQGVVIVHQADTKPQAAVIKRPVADTNTRCVERLPGLPGGYQTLAAVTRVLVAVIK